MAVRHTRDDDQRGDIPPMRVVRRPHREPNYDLDAVPTAHLSRDGGPGSAPMHPPAPPSQSQPLPPDYTNLRGYGVMNTEEWKAFHDLQKWVAVYERILRAEPMPFRSHEHPMAETTNEIMYDCVAGLRKVARKMETLALKKAQRHDIHLKYDDPPWSGGGGA